MKKSSVLLLAVLALVVFAPAAFAADAVAPKEHNMMVLLGSMLGLGLAASCGTIGMGVAISGALSAMARNPGIYSKLFPSMLIGLALIESLVIYTLVIVLILLYANPL